MGRLKKGSRKIVVNGAEYRWRVPKRPTRGPGKDFHFGTLTYTVELAATNGASLVVHTAHPRSENWYGAHLEGNPVAITPSDVERCICAAIQLGWLPSQPGKVFEYEDNQQ